MPVWMKCGRWQFDWNQVVAMEFTSSGEINAEPGNLIRILLLGGHAILLNEAETVSFKKHLDTVTTRDLDSGESSHFGFV